MRRLVRSIEALSRLSGAVAALLVFVLIVLMVYEVVVRYVLGAPTMWSYEVGTWVMGASFVLAIGYALAAGSHVRVDFLHDALGPRSRHAFDLAFYVAFLLPLLLWLVWGLWEYFYGAFSTGERSGQSAWNPRIWPFRLVLLLGVVVWTLQVAAEIAKSAAFLLRCPLDGGPAPPAE